MAVALFVTPSVVALPDGSALSWRNVYPTPEAVPLVVSRSSVHSRSRQVTSGHIKRYLAPQKRGALHLRSPGHLISWGRPPWSGHQHTFHRHIEARLPDSGKAFRCWNAVVWFDQKYLCMGIKYYNNIWTDGRGGGSQLLLTLFVWPLTTRPPCGTEGRSNQNKTWIINDYTIWPCDSWADRRLHRVFSRVKQYLFPKASELITARSQIFCSCCCSDNSVTNPSEASESEKVRHCSAEVRWTFSGCADEPLSSADGIIRHKNMYTSGTAITFHVIELLWATQTILQQKSRLVYMNDSSAEK